MKKAAWILTASLALLPAWALAEDAKPDASKAVQLSDAELDKVHAGTFTLLTLQNPATPTSLVSSRNHVGCINQCGAPTENGAIGQLIVITPFQVIQRCVGRCL